MTENAWAARPDPARRREMILDAATELIALHGLEELGINRIGRQTGLPPGAISTLFHGRQHILCEVCERHADHLVAAAETADLPGVALRRRLDALALALTRAVRQQRRAHQVLALGRATLPPQAQRDIERRLSWLGTLLAEAFGACVKGAAPRNVQAAANTLLTVLLADRPEPLAPDAYARFAVTCTLEGLRRRPGRLPGPVLPGPVRNGSRCNSRRSCSGTAGS